MADKFKEFASLDEATEFSDALAKEQGYPLPWRHAGKGRHVDSAPTTHWVKPVHVDKKFYYLVDQKAEALEGKSVELKEDNKPSKQVTINIGATKNARDVLVAYAVALEDLDVKEK